MKNVSKAEAWSFWLAMIIVVGSHIYMLVYGLPDNQLTGHAVVNLVAGGLFGFTWYKRK